MHSAALALLAVVLLVVDAAAGADVEVLGGGRELGRRLGKHGGGKHGGGYGRHSEAIDVTTKMAGKCGDKTCMHAPENAAALSSCMADCPGVTTPRMCGEEPHSDPGGNAVVWGAAHKKTSASECCDACAAHAANPRNQKRPCNSWVRLHRLKPSLIHSAGLHDSHFTACKRLLIAPDLHGRYFATRFHTAGRWTLATCT